MNPYCSHQRPLRLIASILLIQRREKCPSREGKSAFTQWFSSVYIRSLKDQVRKSQYPRTQILDPRTQSKLIGHSSTTFIPTRSNNLIEVTLQSYIRISPKLYSFLLHPIQLYTRTYITYMRHCARLPLHYSYLLPTEIGGFRLRSSKAESASCEEMALRNGLLITKRLSSRQPSNGGCDCGAILSISYLSFGVIPSPSHWASASAGRFFLPLHEAFQCRCCEQPPIESFIVKYNR